MRIFFTGAQGTGKSTLVYELHRMYPQLKMYDSMSRKFMEGKKDVQFTEDFQKKISLYCLDFYVNDRDFICSRSYFDSIAYPMHGNDIDIVNMVRLYQKYMFEDDCLYFYLPIEFQLSNGGNNLRVTDEKYQHEIDQILRAEIERVNYDKLFTLTGSIEERTKDMQRIVESYMN